MYHVFDTLLWFICWQLRLVTCKSSDLYSKHMKNKLNLKIILQNLGTSTCYCSYIKLEKCNGITCHIDLLHLYCMFEPEYTEVAKDHCLAILQLPHYPRSLCGPSITLTVKILYLRNSWRYRVEIKTAYSGLQILKVVINQTAKSTQTKDTVIKMGFSYKLP